MSSAPVVVVQGGISADRNALPGENIEGWWHGIAGDGRAIDTRRCRVLSIDWLECRDLGDALAVDTRDQAVADEQAEPHPLDPAGVSLQTIKRLKHPLSLLDRNPWAVVPDLDVDVPALGQPLLDGQLLGGAQRLAREHVHPGADAQPALAGRVAAGVVQKTAQDLLKPRALGLQLRQLGLQLDLGNAIGIEHAQLVAEIGQDLHQGDLQAVVEEELLPQQPRSFKDIVDQPARAQDVPLDRHH